MSVVTKSTAIAIAQPMDGPKNDGFGVVYLFRHLSSVSVFEGDLVGGRGCWA